MGEIVEITLFKKRNTAFLKLLFFWLNTGTVTKQDLEEKKESKFVALVALDAVTPTIFWLEIPAVFSLFPASLLTCSTHSTCSTCIYKEYPISKLQIACGVQSAALSTCQHLGSRRDVPPTHHSNKYS